MLQRIIQFASKSKNRGIALLAMDASQRHESCFSRACCALQHGHRATEAGNPALPAAQERAIEPGACELVEAMTAHRRARTPQEPRGRRGHADEADEAGAGAFPAGEHARGAAAGRRTAAVAQASVAVFV